MKNERNVVGARPKDAEGESGPVGARAYSRTGSGGRMTDVPSKWAADVGGQRAGERKALTQTTRGAREERQRPSVSQEDKRTGKVVGARRFELLTFCTPSIMYFHYIPLFSMFSKKL